MGGSKAISTLRARIPSPSQPSRGTAGARVVVVVGAVVEVVVVLLLVVVVDDVVAGEVVVAEVVVVMAGRVVVAVPMVKGVPSSPQAVTMREARTSPARVRLGCKWSSNGWAGRGGPPGRAVASQPNPQARGRPAGHTVMPLDVRDGRRWAGYAAGSAHKEL